jgi:glycine cleavage system H protein
VSCHLPEDLYYWPEKHVWARLEQDGAVTIGITDAAQNLAGKIVVANIRSPGKTLARGKSAGTLESGKWVGPVPTPVAGEVLEVNEAVRQPPGLINSDPYGAGWVVRLRPDDWSGDAALLVTGADGVEAYRAAIVREGIECKEAR